MVQSLCIRKDIKYLMVTSSGEQFLATVMFV